MLRETAPTLAIIKVAGRQRGGPSGRTARLPDPARRCRLCPNPHGPVHRFRSLLPRTWQQQGSGFAVSTKQDSLGFSVVGNSGTGDCFWLAQQQLVGLEPQNAKAASYAWALQAKHPALLEKHAFFAQKVPATEAQIEAAVHAHPFAYPNGLAIVHMPASQLVLFRPGAKPEVFPLSEHRRVLHSVEGPAAMLYSEVAGLSGQGHIEALRREAAPRTQPQGNAEASQNNTTYNDTVPRIFCGMESFSTMLDDSDDEAMPDAAVRTLMEATGVSQHRAAAAVGLYGHDLNRAADWALQQPFCSRPSRAAFRHGLSSSSTDVHAQCRSRSPPMQHRNFMSTMDGGAAGSGPAASPQPGAAALSASPASDDSDLWAAVAFVEGGAAAREASSAAAARPVSNIDVHAGIGSMGAAANTSIADGDSDDADYMAAIAQSEGVAMVRAADRGAVLQTTAHGQAHIADDDSDDADYIAAIAQSEGAAMLRAADRGAVLQPTAHAQSHSNRSEAAASVGDAGSEALAFASAQLASAVPAQRASSSLSETPVLISLGSAAPVTLQPDTHRRAASRTSIPAQMQRPCFKIAPDTEVSWWTDQLLGTSPERLQTTWRSIPMYTQYIEEHTVDEVIQHTMDVLDRLPDNQLDGSAALEVSPRLGAVMPLPLAVAISYCSVTTAKPVYFLSDMCMALQASLLHPEAVVEPYANDSDFRISPRYWALPTGDTTAGKSPTCTYLTRTFLEATAACGAAWPFAGRPQGILHSDGTHGLFNETMRETNGHVAFIGPEAVNYLSPEFPWKGKCDTSAYVDIARLLDLANGGQYKWGTATEQKRMRAAALRRRPSQSIMPGNVASLSAAAPPDAAASSSQRDSPRTSLLEDERPLFFPNTNVNICWLQQLSLLRTWWAPAEKKELGFAGRFVIGYSTERSVPPGCRRPGGRLLAELLQQAWGDTVVHWGPTADPSTLCAKFTAVGHQKWEGVLYDAFSCKRALRRKFPYAQRAAMGKWEYWCCTVAMLNHTIESSLRGDPSSRIMSENTLKCACRFIDQRLVFGAAVLQAEIDKLTRTAAASTSQRAGSLSSASEILSDVEASVSEFLRSVPDHAVSFRTLSARLTPYRRQSGERDEAWQVRRAQIFNHTAALGLGIVEAAGRSPMFHKAVRTAALERTLIRLGVPLESFPSQGNNAGATDAADRGSNARMISEPTEPTETTVPHMHAGMAPKQKKRSVAAPEPTIRKPSADATQRTAAKPIAAMREGVHGQQLHRFALKRPASAMTDDFRRSPGARSSQARIGAGPVCRRPASRQQQTLPRKRPASALQAALRVGARGKLQQLPWRLSNTAQGIYTEKASWRVASPFATEQEFRLAVKQWGESTTPGETLSICTQGKTSTSTLWRQRFWCGSCTKCITKKNRPSGNGWCGIADYNTMSCCITFRYTPSRHHGNFDRKNGAAGLTSTSKRIVKDKVESGVTNTQQLLDALRGQPDQPPRESKLGVFASRHGKQHRKRHILPRPGNRAWGRCDWQRIIRGLPSLSDLGPDSACKLCVVDSLLTVQHTVVVFCYPALVRAVFAKLSNKEYIKLCWRLNVFIVANRSRQSASCSYWWVVGHAFVVLFAFDHRLLCRSAGFKFWFLCQAMNLEAFLLPAGNAIISS